jgi:hypothetical protein
MYRGPVARPNCVHLEVVQVELPSKSSVLVLLDTQLFLLRNQHEIVTMKSDGDAENIQDSKDSVWKKGI